MMPLWLSALRKLGRRKWAQVCTVAVWLCGCVAVGGGGGGGWGWGVGVGKVRMGLWLCDTMGSPDVCVCV